MMTQQKLQPEWRFQRIRLDPFRFPQRVQFQSRQGEVSFILHERGVTVRRILPSSKLPMSFEMLPSDFKGVTARAVEGRHGEITITLELMHSDCTMSVPLLATTDLDEVANDWRQWARLYNLPMLLAEEDGLVQPLEKHVGPITPNKTAQHKKPVKKTAACLRLYAQHVPLRLRLIILGRKIIIRG